MSKRDVALIFGTLHHLNLWVFHLSERYHILFFNFIRNVVVRPTVQRNKSETWNIKKFDIATKKVSAVSEVVKFRANKTNYFIIIFGSLNCSFYYRTFLFFSLYLSLVLFYYELIYWSTFVLAGRFFFCFRLFFIVFLFFSCWSFLIGSSNGNNLLWLFL